jgi:hypothetical protein
MFPGQDYVTACYRIFVLSLRMLHYTLEQENNTCEHRGVKLLNFVLCLIKHVVKLEFICLYWPPFCTSALLGSELKETLRT